MSGTAGGCPVTATPAGGRADGDPGYPEWCLRQVRVELRARGFAVTEPEPPGSCQCFIDLHGGQCELDLLATGALVWEYLPRQAAALGPGEAARMVTALLGCTGPARSALRAARDPGLALAAAAGRILAASGLDVRAADASDGGACTAAVATSPAEPGRGFASIGDDGTIRWECRFASRTSPARGLPPGDVARAITAALAGHATAESAVTPLVPACGLRPATRRNR
jgi:hypothetical protein